MLAPNLLALHMAPSAGHLQDLLPGQPIVGVRPLHSSNHASYSHMHGLSSRLASSRPHSCAFVCASCDGRCRSSSWIPGHCRLPGRLSRNRESSLCTALLCMGRQCLQQNGRLGPRSSHWLHCLGVACLNFQVGQSMHPSQHVYMHANCIVPAQPQACHLSDPFNRLVYNTNIHGSVLSKQLTQKVWPLQAAKAQLQASAALTSTGAQELERRLCNAEDRLIQAHAEAASLRQQHQVQPLPWSVLPCPCKSAGSFWLDVWNRGLIERQSSRYESV